MPASFLHGVETIEITKGAKTITTVKTAVVGIVGTAPIQDVAEEYRTIKTPTLKSEQRVGLREQDEQVATPD